MLTTFVFANAGLQESHGGEDQEESGGIPQENEPDTELMHKSQKYEARLFLLRILPAARVHTIHHRFPQSRSSKISLAHCRPRDARRPLWKEEEEQQARQQT